MSETSSIEIKELVDPQTISKNKDQEGRDRLAAEIRGFRQQKDQLSDDIKHSESKFNERQENILVKIKDVLHIPDKEKIELEEQLLRQKSELIQLPDRQKIQKMIEAYREKAAETPLTNREKRDLLKPEVLAQLSIDEYIALWKRLNPYFLSHVTRQGFRDHTGNNIMVMHTSGLEEFVNGFVDIMQNGKSLIPVLTMEGVTQASEVDIEMYLSKYVLQKENSEDAEDVFKSIFVYDRDGMAPYYPDKSAMHFAAQKVSDRYYGGEGDNEVFFIYPSDVVASQNSFAFHGGEKDFTRPQSEVKWNDVFVWPNKENGNGISVDSGLVFLPEFTPVDPTTGSKYASEVKIVDGKEQRVMTEDKDLTEKFIAWANGLGENSDVIKRRREISEERNYLEQQGMSSSYDSFCMQEIEQLGFSEDAALQLVDSFQSKIYMKTIGGEADFEKLIKGSSARFKRAENAITAKEYWEDYFSKNPDLKPKHVVYYDGDPTSAVYRFQQKSGIGTADTSSTEGQLLGFDDHHVIDVADDPRSNHGHQELVDLGNKIISEHYGNKI